MNIEYPIGSYNYSKKCTFLYGLCLLENNILQAFSRPPNTVDSRVPYWNFNLGPHMGLCPRRLSDCSFVSNAKKYATDKKRFFFHLVLY